MTIPDWLQRLGARVFPSIFLTPLGDAPTTEHVDPDHPRMIGGVMHFNRGNRTDAEFRAFVMKTMADAAESASKRNL